MIPDDKFTKLNQQGYLEVLESQSEGLTLDYLMQELDIYQDNFTVFKDG